KLATTAVRRNSSLPVNACVTCAGQRNTSMPLPIPPEDRQTPIIRPLSPATPQFTSERCSMPSTLVIEFWAVERLSPYPTTLRKNHHAVDRMIASFREYGFKIPLLVSADGEIIDGHLRLKAAQK